MSSIQIRVDLRASLVMDIHSGWQGRFGSPTRALGSVFVLLVFVPPLVLLVSGSFYEPGLPPRPRPEVIPDPASTLGYQLAFEWGGLLRAGVNSLIVAVIAVPLSVLVAAATGFALVHVAPWL